MFLSQSAFQVQEVSPAPVGTMIMPVWLLSLFAALMAMTLFLAIGRRKPHPVFNWLSLAFFVAAMVSASQTRFVTHLVQALDALLKASLVMLSNVFAQVTWADLTTSAVAFGGLLFCLWKYHRGQAENDAGLQIGMAFVIGLLMIFLSQFSDPARQFTDWLLNYAVGGVLAGIMSLVGGGGLNVPASSSRAVIAIPVWFALAIFSLLVMVTFVALNRRRAEKSNGYKWVILISGTVAVLSASQASVVVYMTAACQDLIAGINGGLSRVNLETTTSVAALIAIAICLGIFFSTRLRFVKNPAGRAPSIIRGVTATAIPLLLLILVQSNAIAVQLSSGLVAFGSGALNVVTSLALAI